MELFELAQFYFYNLLQFVTNKKWEYYIKNLDAKHKTKLRNVELEMLKPNVTIILWDFFCKI